ncbi:MAG: hypothetical protein BWK78_09465 [Thiotrichaceae bacterium IS1]|nr:MAG: hypothetical protein BWK78_09465 [Thiotrichaceae bacterium IS1]
MTEWLKEVIFLDAEYSMGCESFQIILKCPLGEKNVTNIIISFPKVTPDSSCVPIASELYFQYRDADHIIELEVDCYQNATNCVVSCRFALCHPQSIDKFFINFVKQIVNRLPPPTMIEINEELPEDFSNVFVSTDMIGFEQSVKTAIEIKRTYWIKDFGAETAVLTCYEALKKFCYL